MSALPACFENIVGLSRTDCECVEDRPIEAGESASGLYIDELAGLGLRMAEAGVDCGQGTLWDMLARAREEAIKETKEKLGSCINANTDSNRQLGQAIIGEDKKATALSHSLRSAYHGVTLQTAKVKGGYFEVVAIGVALRGDALPGTITLNVYERELNNSAAIGTYVLPVTSNKLVWTDLPAPLELSMTELGSENPRYWFVYEPPTGAKALNTLISCNCNGFSPDWDLNNPQYNSRQQKGGKLWAEWAMAAGTKGTTLEDRESWTLETPTNGLLLKVVFHCDESTSYCADPPKYQQDAIQMTIAHAVRFRAGSRIISSILASTEINAYTMTSGDTLEKTRGIYDQGWADAILDHVCPELSNKNNVNRYGDCRKCKDHFGFRKGGIFS